MDSSRGMMPMPQAVGIDLGTTFSVIAIVGQDGKAQALPNTEGVPVTPSVAIWYQGAFLVGQPALDLIKKVPAVEQEQVAAGLIRGVKRMMGHPPTGGLVSLGYRTTPVEVSAAILAKLARDASAYLGFRVCDVVVTTPAHFGDRERHTTKLAAEMAGLNVLQIINEPSAAALAYSRGQKATPGLVLVFDLGGGTFDATILQLGENEGRVLATQGIEELGGINFTNKLAVDLKRHYEAQAKIPYPDDPVSSDILVGVAERAKCLLSNEQSVTIPLTPMHGPTAELQMTRKQFERLISLYLIQLQTEVEIALERIHKTPEDISRVLLCGGSARIPAVQNMLEELFGRAPEHFLDLDLSVALGAAYQAAICERAQQGPGAGLQMLPDAGLIVDCVSYSVGIAVLDVRGERLVKLVLLHPGDPLDTWSQPYAVRIAGNVRQFPPVAVYKGEEPQLDPNDYLGDIALTLPPDLASGARATIRMQQDQSGLVQIQITVAERELPGSLRRA